MTEAARLEIYPRWHEWLLCQGFRLTVMAWRLEYSSIRDCSLPSQFIKRHQSFPRLQHQTRSAISMYWLRKLLSLPLGIELLLLSLPATDAGSWPTCSHIYGHPAPADCASALAKIPRDATSRFFVEQQMRTELPVANWIPFVDTRRSRPQPVSQLPKWWSRGRVRSPPLLDLATGCSEPAR